VILVTGGTGLLGSHVLYELCAKGELVRALYRSTKKKDRILTLFSHYDEANSQEMFQRIEWVKGDVNDIISLEDAMQNINVVYHCAAIVSFDKRDFRQMYKVNREGTANVVNVALAAGVEQFCHVSSTAAIGGTSSGEINELNKWRKTTETTGYSMTKYSSEKEVWRAAEEGMRCVVVNPCVIIGPGNWEESSLTLLGSINRGLPFYTPGSNAIVDARDVAEIMVQLIANQVVGERFLCIGHNLSFRDLSTNIAMTLGKKPPNLAVPRWIAMFTSRILYFFSLFNNSRPVLTPETVRAAFSTMIYSNKKVREQTRHTFRTLDDTLQNAVAGRIQ
jgi:dihydroflavonol-4-reductase